MQAFVLLLLCVGCSSTEIKNPHTIEKVLSNPLRFRRPLGEGAHPLAGPGGLDFYQNPAPDERLDCRTPREVFDQQKIVYSDVRECLNSLKEGPVRARYEMERKPVKPFLEFDHEDEDEEEAQKLSCLKDALQKIPVPREIIFLSHKESRIECFSARLDVESWGDAVVNVHLPSVGGVVTDEDVIRYLTSWAMTPVFSEENQSLRSRLMPESICEKCFADPELFERYRKEKQPSPPWP